MLGGLVVDSSVWIDYLNDDMDSLEVLDLDRLLEENGNILLCPVVYQEVLQGIRTEKMFQYVKSLFCKFKMLESSFPNIEDIAVDLYRSLRMKGITIRKPNDCLIAAYAIYYNVPVLSRDHDFDLMYQHTSLQKY